MQSVSVAEIAYRPSFSAEVLSAAHFQPPLSQTKDLLLSIIVPAFAATISGEVTDLHINDGYEEVSLESFVDAGVSTLLTLRSEPSNGAAANLQIKEASLSFHVTEHRPRAHFIANTLYAMLGLAGPVRISIPDMLVDLGLCFNIPTSDLSKLLQLRQTYFGLMVIEKAAGLEFEIPEHISGYDLNSISFAYHAILQREFVWRSNDVTQSRPANEEALAWIDNLPGTKPNESTYRITFGPIPRTQTILGKEVPLGEETIFIEDGIIENRENVRRELSQKDGHTVPIRIRPRSRLGRYVFSNTPRLPKNPWDEKIASLINLEDKLNELLAARYHELAASTVADLTPEEIETVTARPELDEDAYLIRD